MVENYNLTVSNTIGIVSLGFSYATASVKSNRKFTKHNSRDIILIPKCKKERDIKKTPNHLEE